MLNSLALRALSGIMAINMAAAPISTQVNNDIENTRYYGTYETHLLSGGKIIINSSGCKLEKFYLGNPQATYPYITTSYTREYTIDISNFTATLYPSQYVYVNANGEKRNPTSTDIQMIQGEVDERDEANAPRRRYITAYKFLYWKDV